MKKIIFLFVVAMFLGCNNGGQKSDCIHSVYVVSPTLSAGSVVKTYSGIIDAAHEISLGFKTAGQLDKIYVKEGDYVRKGQLLAVLDQDDYKLGVDALQIQYDQLKDEVERTIALYKRNSVSANDYEKAVAGLKQLGVQLQVNKNKLDYTTLYAPTSGYIQAVNFSPAEMVDAGTAVFTILDVSHMEVIADIPVSEYNNKNLFKGYSCSVVGSSENYSMNLLSLTPKADGNQLYQLRLTFAKPTNLTAGLNVEVKIDIANSENGGYILPLSALFQSGEEACVWVLGEDNIITKRVVKVSPTLHEGKAVILEGLNGDERVVSAGANILQQGEKVMVANEVSATNVGGLI